tara:strand:+ start:411 stop:599 length:189 start_codon:yes stop_codon:yes gene_type:complete
MSLHEHFNIEKHPETEIKKSKKNKIANKVLNNKRLIMSIVIYIFLSTIYTTGIIILTIIKLF